MSDVPPLTPLDTLKIPPKLPQNPEAIRNFNYEGSYLPSLICNIVVKADLGRSPGRSTPQYWHLVVKNGNLTLLLTYSGQEWQLADLLADLPPNASWDIYYGMYLAAILDSSRKGGNFLYFWIIRVVNSQLALYSHVRCNPTPWHPQNTPKTPSKHLQLQLEISTMRAHICQV